VTRFILKACDGILFFRPHPQVPISLFWLVISAALATMLDNVREYRALTTLQAGKHANPKMAIRLLVKERNYWVASFVLLLFVCIHQFRHQLKEYQRLKQRFLPLLPSNEREDDLIVK
jgi:hypothetical protein